MSAESISDAGGSANSSYVTETLHGTFIDIEVAEPYASDADLARKLEEVCPVDIFKATDGGVEIVRENLDECVLCFLCVEAAPQGAIQVKKLYES